MYIVRRYKSVDNSEETFYKVLMGEPVEENTFNYGTAATTTIKRRCLPPEYQDMFNAKSAYEKIKKILESAEGIDPNKCYRTYYILKQNGKQRRIDDPSPELRAIHDRIANVLIRDFGALYHNSAWAYIKYRDPYRCLKKHVNSNWFMKTDFHDFFGSTTLDTCMKMLWQIFPFNQFFKNEQYESDFIKLLRLCFFNGGLPQGTTISPMLTNLIMIPFDYEMSVRCAANKIIYTRYADDCLFSSTEEFKRGTIIGLIKDVLHKLGYHYSLNSKKTRYGSNKGRNFNLGLMLNADHNITIGHEAKRKLKTDLFRLIKDVDKGILTIDWLKSLEGRLNYYRYIEPERMRQLECRELAKQGRWWWAIDGVIRRALDRAINPDLHF